MKLRITNLSKSFRVYPRPRHWLFEKLSLGRKTYHREVGALRELNLELKDGECLGIIGKNGAGKSSLLRIVAGISPPGSGEIELEGRVGSLLELGSGFHPEFTGRENLRLNGMIAGFEASELDRQVEAMIAFSELGEFIELPVRTYSDGMYLRLGFSLVQGLSPDLFLIDEALAVGDEYFRGKCLRRMLEFKEQGKAMIIASHDLTMIRGLCDRAAYLEKGALARIGPAAEVIETYLDEIYREAAGSAKPLPAAGEWKRRGSGEARITGARMLDGQGRPATIFRPGDSIEIEFRYTARAEVRQPLFGVNIFRSDGVLVLSTNQECAAGSGAEFGQAVASSLGASIPAGRSGVVKYSFRNLLLPGRYQLSVNLFTGKSGAATAVDEVFDLIRFEVGESKILDRGVFLNRGSWEIE